MKGHEQVLETVEREHVASLLIALVGFLKVRRPVLGSP